jgi:hypothetical protein
MSQRVLRHNLGFIAGLVALSYVVACSDDTTTNTPVTDASMDAAPSGDAGNDTGTVNDSSADVSQEAATNEAGMEASTGSDGSTEAATGNDGSTEAAANDSGEEGSTGGGDGATEAAAHDGATEGSSGGGDGATEAAVLDGGTDAEVKDATVMDGGNDATVMDSGNDVTMTDGGSEAMPGDAMSDGSDGAVVPALEVTFGGAADGGPLSQINTSGGTGWQWKWFETELTDGGTSSLTGSSLTIIPADASPGALDWNVPFTGPSQTAEIVLWSAPPGQINAVGRTLTIVVQGLAPVTNDPNNPGTWDLFLQSVNVPADGGSWDISNYDWTVAWNTNLATPDGGANAVQTLSFPLSAGSSNIDLTQLTTIGIDLSTPASPAVDAGVTYSTANVLIQSVTIE